MILNPLEGGSKVSDTNGTSALFGEHAGRELPADALPEPSAEHFSSLKPGLPVLL
jgi:hypothetical protein